jgi:hypothetical protein
MDFRARFDHDGSNYLDQNEFKYLCAYLGRLILTNLDLFGAAEFGMSQGFLLS